MRQTPKALRRSNNLKLSSLEPLQTVITDPNDQVPSYWPSTTISTSYIAGRSAPTTPGILSRSSSSHRLKSSHRSSTRLALTDLDGIRGLPKSKSTSVLVLRAQGHIPSQDTKKVPLKISTTPAAAAFREEGEWLFRAGLAISSEARENKGQSWLASRASSTSLALGADNDRYDYQDGGRPAGGRLNTVLTSPYGSRQNMGQSNSRLHSARHSRRGSKVGSRSELSFFTPGPARTPLHHEVFEDEDRDYFGDAPVAAVGPDFVDPDDLEDTEDLDVGLDDVEVANLTKQRSFGLGGLVDRLVAWSLFDIRDDEPESEEEAGFIEGNVALSAVERTTGREVSEKAMVVKEVSRNNEWESRGEDEGFRDDQGGWNDVAWLLSVASKVLL